MNRLRLCAAGLAVAAAAAGTPALVGQARGAAHATPPSHRVQPALYVFRGFVVTAPGANATQLQVDVRSGNRPALRVLIGAAQPLIFTVDSRTHYVAEAANNQPHASSSAAMAAGDPVLLRVFAPAGAPLARVLATPARFVDDLADATRPHGRMFLFEGRAAAPLDTEHKTVTIDVSFGNWRALYAMLGAPIRQTFRYDDDTTFLHWDAGQPHLISPSAIKTGDVLTLRVFSPNWNSSLAVLEATPLWRVNDHEPQPQIDAAAGGGH